MSRWDALKPTNDDDRNSSNLHTRTNIRNYDPPPPGFYQNNGIDTRRTNTTTLSSSSRLSCTTTTNTTTTSTRTTNTTTTTNPTPSFVAEKKDVHNKDKTKSHNGIITSTKLWRKKSDLSSTNLTRKSRTTTTIPISSTRSLSGLSIASNETTMMVHHEHTSFTTKNQIENDMKYLHQLCNDIRSSKDKNNNDNNNINNTLLSQTNIVVDDKLQKLKTILMSVIYSLSSEQAQQMIVHDLLLKHLSTIRTSVVHVHPMSIAADDRNKNMDHEITILFLDTIKSLLDNKKYMLPIMVPKVNEVTTTGNEYLLINPTRIYLYEVLEQFMNQFIAVLNSSSHHTTRTEEETCNADFMMVHGTVFKSVAQLLVKTLQVAMEINGIKKHNETMTSHQKDYDMNPKLIIQLITLLCTTRNGYEDGIQYSLQIMHAFLQRHPDSASLFATSFIFPNNNKNNNNNNHEKSIVVGGKNHNECCRKNTTRRCCSRCRFNETNHVFLANLLHEPLHGNHNSSSIVTLNTVMSCYTLILQHIPIQLWLRPDTKRGSSTTTMKNVHSSTNFRTRCVDAMYSTYCVIQCHLYHYYYYYQNDCLQYDYDTKTFCHFISVLLMSIPIRLNDPLLYKAANELVQTLVNTMLLLDTTEKEEETMQNRQRQQKNLIDIFIECLGGRMTPQGVPVPMSSLIRSWLIQQQQEYNVMQQESFRNSSSFKYIPMILMNSLMNEKYLCDRSTDLKLLNSLLERFHVGIGDESTYSTFQKMIVQMINASDPTKQTECVTLVSSFLKGRQSVSTLDDGTIIEGTTGLFSSSHVVPFIVPLLLRIVSKIPRERVNSQLHGGIVALSMLTMADWKWMILNTNNDNIFSAGNLISLILCCCSDPSLSGKIRSEICKSIGTICSHYFPAHTSFVDESENKLTELFEVMLCMQNKIYSTLLHVLVTDESAVVRCMALFAVGNLAQSIGDYLSRSGHLSDVIFPNQTIRILIQCGIQCYTLMDEKYDDKGVSNALRAAGHHAAVFLRLKYETLDTAVRTQISRYLLDFVNQLIMYIHDCITFAASSGGSTDNSIHHRSWKQRMGMKKRGWGACNVLGLLLHHHLSESEWDYCMITTNSFSFMEVQNTCMKPSRLSQRTFLCLLECIIQVPNHMNEKVILSAISAIVGFDAKLIPKILRWSGPDQSPDYVSLKRSNTILSSVITVCCDGVLCSTTFVQKQRDDGIRMILSDKMVRELEVLLLFLLPCCTEVDAYHIIESSTKYQPLNLNDTSRTNNNNEMKNVYHHNEQQQQPQQQYPTDFLIPLYHWMVGKDCHPIIFDTFARAMRLPGVVVEIKVEQLFANHRLTTRTTMNHEQNHHMNNHTYNTTSSTGSHRRRPLFLFPLQTERNHNDDDDDEI